MRQHCARDLKRMRLVNVPDPCSASRIFFIMNLTKFNNYLRTCICMFKYCRLDNISASSANTGDNMKYLRGLDIFSYARLDRNHKL